MKYLCLKVAIKMYKAKYVIELIHKSFDNYEYPGVEYIASPYTAKYEIDKFYYEHRVWQDIVKYDLDSRFMDLHLLAPGGLRFFLPAFMINSIYYINDVPLDWLISNLTAPDKSDNKRYEWFLNRFRGYSPQQADAIRHFLNYVVLVCYEGQLFAQKALVRYWDKTVIKHWTNLFL